MIKNTTLTPYEQLGGEVGIHALVHRFYDLMEILPEAYTVRKMHPENLEGSAAKLFEYLSGWLGGPPLYVAKKGHPRLRMRHAPYAIGAVVRDEWLHCMSQALTEFVADATLRAQLLGAFTQLANHLVNTECSHSCPD